MILHRNGLTFSQPLGDTNILVAAPGADNAAIENNTGVKTDWRGYAVIPYATAYRENRVALDLNTLDKRVDLSNAVVSIVPTQGAIVRAKFEPRVGIRALLTLMHSGKTVPFGATVSRNDSGNSSIVGDSGDVYLSALPLSGVLNVQWGGGENQHCTVHYQLPEEAVNQVINKFTEQCS